LGQRDLTMTEAAAIIGKAIGKPDLPYKQLTDDQFRAALTQVACHWTSPTSSWRWLER